MSMCAWKSKWDTMPFESLDVDVKRYRFASREAYKIHTSSDHIRRWAEKYYFNSEIFDGEFEFHHMAKGGEVPGGFDRQ